MTFGYFPLNVQVQPRTNGLTFQGSPVMRQLNSWPPSNLHEDGEAYHLELAVPGFKAADFSLSLEQDVIRVHGKPAEPAGTDRKYQLREWQNQEFTFRKRVPRPVDAEGITATYEDGILRVRLPKAAEARPRIIEITTPNTEA